MYANYFILIFLQGFYGSLSAFSLSFSLSPYQLINWHLIMVLQGNVFVYLLSVL